MTGMAATSATTVQYGSDWWIYAESDQLALGRGKLVRVLLGERIDPQLPHHGGVEVAEVDRLGDVRIRFRQVLARLENLPGAEGRFVPSQKICHLLQ